MALQANKPPLDFQILEDQGERYIGVIHAGHSGDYQPMTQLFSEIIEFSDTESVHPEWIQNEEMMRQKIDYIHYNPVKRGYVDEAEYWRYSSARNYARVSGLLDVCRQW